LQRLLVEAFGSVLLSELSEFVLKRLILVGELLDLLLELRQLVLLGLQQLLRSSNALDLVLLLLPLDVVQLTLVDLDKLVHIMQLLFDELELLVQVGRRFVVLR
jgi:hypothetical protein